MHTPRMAELCLEACDRAADAVGLMNEFEESNHHHGNGVHRDPVNVFAELREELSDLLATVREARDEVERQARGLRP